MRCTTVRVLPDPAPASTRAGPSKCSTAARCSSFSGASSSSGDTTADDTSPSCTSGAPALRYASSMLNAICFDLDGTLGHYAGDFQALASLLRSELMLQQCD